MSFRLDEALAQGKQPIQERALEKKKTTTITSETHELFIVTRRSKQSNRSWCPACLREVEMLNPEEAAAIAQVNTRTIYRRIESGELHHIESGDDLLVCPKHLLP